MHPHVRRPTAAAAVTTVLALLASLLVTSPAAASEPADAATDSAAELTPVPADGATLLDLVFDTTVDTTVDAPLRLGILPAPTEPGSPAAVVAVDPADTLLVVDDTSAVTGLVSAAHLELPEGYTATGAAAVNLTGVTGPEGASVSVTDATGTVLLGTAPLPTGDAAPVTLALDGATDLTGLWAFSAHGDYSMTLDAVLPVTDAAGVTGSLATAATTYQFSVGAAADAAAAAAATEAVAAAAAEAEAEAVAVAVAEAEAEATMEAEVDAAESATAAESARAEPTDDQKVADVATGDDASVAGGSTSDSGDDVSATTTYASTMASAVSVDSSTETVTTEPPVVLSAGNLAISPKLSASAAAEEGDFDGVTLGISDRTRGVFVPSDWYGLDSAVIHLGNDEFDADSGTWATPSVVPDLTGYTRGDAARVVLGLDQAISGRSHNIPYTWDMPLLSGTAVLSGVTGSGTAAAPGIVRVTDAMSGQQVWDSSRFGASAQTTVVDWNKGSRAHYSGWSFSDEGKYCVTMTVGIVSTANGVKTATDTFTFYVGDLPETVVPCALDTDLPDVIEEEEEEPEAETHFIHENGHIDYRVHLVDGEIATAMSFSITRDRLYEPFDNIVLAGTKPVQTVPEPTQTTDLTGIGPVGTEYWHFPTSGGSENWVWPGFNTEEVDADAVISPITTTLTDYSVNGVRQPDDADFVLQGGSAAPVRRGPLLLSTRLGLPQSFELGVNQHTHQEWAFTAQGVYCLSLTSSAIMADGHRSSDDGILTVVVGDIDASTVVPCELQNLDVAPVVQKSAPAIDTTDVYLATDGDVQLDLFGDNGLDLVASTASDAIGSLMNRRADDLVISTSNWRPEGLWRLTGLGSTRLGQAAGLDFPGMTLDTTGVLPDSLLSDTAVTMALGDVAGPGDFSFINYADRSAAALDSAPGGPRSTTLSAMSRATKVWWDVTEAGIYCVPLTFSSTSLDGTSNSTSTTLTFVAGRLDPEDADYVDRTGITSCANGQQATTADDSDVDGSPEQTPIEWNVANGTLTDSGAVILNDGHVDIASVLVDGSLATQIKDTTESSDAIWRDPAQTVLQVLPGAQTSAPDSSDYAFLGEPGNAVWQVTQTQQQGLLWPGWSTEQIANADTQVGVDWALTDASGPGEFALYEASSTVIGGVDVRFNTRDGLSSADSYVIPKNTHAHGTWAFSAEGSYCLAFTRSTTLAGGASASDDFVLAFAVGEVDVTGIDPADCFAGTPNTEDPGAGEADDGSEVDAGTGSGDTGTGAGTGAGTGTTAPTTPTVTAPASQTQAATQCVAGGTILSAGHVDYASRLVNGRLQSLIKDGSTQSTVWREPSQVVLWLKPSSRVTLPAGYSSIGTVGSSIWQIPQTQNTNLVWLGWNTESLSSAQASGPVTFSLDAVDGPGSVNVYLNGEFGGVKSVVFANGGTHSVDLGKHVHGNWAFSAEGIYHLTFTQSVTLASGQVSRDTATLTVAVGDVDPATAFAGSGGCGAVSNAALLTSDIEAADAAAAAAVEAAAAVKALEDAAVLAAAQVEAEAVATEAAERKLAATSADAIDDVTGDPLAALRAGNPVPALLLTLGLLLVLGAAAGGILWQRKRGWAALPTSARADD
ncbi:hypothetical protein E3T55_02825 [Cryobacterium frigoriphilum]|uniref:Uncharacterized protein n=1 Tax=Cryobacterium frigoriphilum TaxID=1259150 RepID=A0A4R9A9N7_9MICO|nr:TIGR03773 family transporter-associated surface protein [Cryobacterium frigoriphilum]TFD54738.1 hypothetical protein E3T55_02825 [Cryobacterium frigoriphilum]